MKGWAPRDIGEASKYKQEIMSACDPHRVFPTAESLASHDLSLGSLGQAFVSAAQSVSHDTAATSRKRIEQVLDRIRTLEREADEGGIGVEERIRRRRKASKERKRSTNERFFDCYGEGQF